jgi:hypothetical protein
MLIPTSGSSGTPKLIVVTDAMMIRQFTAPRFGVRTVMYGARFVPWILPSCMGSIIPYHCTQTRTSGVRTGGGLVLVFLVCHNEFVPADAPVDNIIESHAATAFKPAACEWSSWLPFR